MAKIQLRKTANLGIAQLENSGLIVEDLWLSSFIYVISDESVVVIRESPTNGSVPIGN